jgi:high frequency lysogenization protein
MVISAWEEQSLSRSITLQQQRVLALAGITQSAALVYQLALQGSVESDSYHTSIESILITSPESTMAVFGGDKARQNLQLGLITLQQIITRDMPTGQRDIIRYVQGLIHLQARLAKQPQMLQLIAERLTHIRQQAQLFHTTHENVVASIADLYSNTLSTFRFRIQVTGNPLYLNSSYNANKVRTLLMAGIRSVTLWRQMGGSLWKLLFFRSQLQQDITALLLPH